MSASIVSSSDSFADSARSDTDSSREAAAQKYVVKSSKDFKLSARAIWFRKLLFACQLFYLIYEIPRNSWAVGTLIGTDSNFRPIVEKAGRLMAGTEPFYLRDDILPSFQFVSFLLVSTNQRMTDKRTEFNTYFARLNTKTTWKSRDTCDKLAGTYIVPNTTDIGNQLMNYVYRRGLSTFTNDAGTVGDFDHVDYLDPYTFGPPTEKLMDEGYRVVFREVEYMYFSGYAGNNTKNRFSVGQTNYRTTCDTCLASIKISRFYCSVESQHEGDNLIRITKSEPDPFAPQHIGIEVESYWQYSLADTLRHFASFLSLYMIWRSYGSVPFITNDDKITAYSSATNFVNLKTKTNPYFMKLNLLFKAQWMPRQQGLVYPTFLTHNIAIIVYINMVACFLDMEMSLMWIEDNILELREEFNILCVLNIIQFSLHFVPLVCGILKIIKRFVRQKTVLRAITHYYYLHVIGVLLAPITAYFIEELFTGKLAKSQSGENLVAVMNINMSYNLNAFKRNSILVCLFLYQVVAALGNLLLRNLFQTRHCYTDLADYCSSVVQASNGVMEQDGHKRGTVYELSMLQMVLDVESAEPLLHKTTSIHRAKKIAPSAHIFEKPDNHSDEAYLAYTRGRCFLTIQGVTLENNLNLHIHSKSAKTVTFVLQQKA